MGHFISKPTVAVATTTTTTNAVVVSSSSTPQPSSNRKSQKFSKRVGNSSQISSELNATTSAISIPAAGTINLQIEESPSSSSSAVNRTTTKSISPSNSQSSDTISNSTAGAGRQIIIKIKLAKMENGNNVGVNSSGDALSGNEETLENFTINDLNANTVGVEQQQIFNLTLNAHENNSITTTAAAAGLKQRTAGSSSASLESPPQISAELNLSTSSEAAAVDEAGVAAFIMNNNNLNGSVNLSLTEEQNTTNTTKKTTERMNALQLKNDDYADDDNDNENDDVERLLRDCSSGSESAVEYCEVLEQPSVDEMWWNRKQESSGPVIGSAATSTNAEVTFSNRCCHSKSSKTTTNSSSTASSSKRRCTKCKCRDAIRDLRGMLMPDSSSSAILRNSGSKDTSKTHSRTGSNCDQRRSIPARLFSAMSPVSSSSSVSSKNSNTVLSPSTTQKQQHRNKRNSIALIPSRNRNTTQYNNIADVASTSTAAAAQNLSIWAPGGANVSDVIIHISTPQFVVEQCATNSAPVVTVGRISEATHGVGIVGGAPAAAAIRLMTAEFVAPLAANRSSLNQSAMERIQQQQQTQQTTTIGLGNALIRSNQTRVPIVHSQIDFVHYLVPDLERITNSSFYWGKMDRYEAERLLEGMPEGTFLLRDSAQEEFLFSVTFRKYERSLHARIEQSGHKFSFDCHDPCVFTAPTVTGLLEHYKDPSCVMFFEPMLTVPLHRKSPFSLQQLCRATIVSNTSYDGINQMELPTRLKSYCKEYHYKQKLRVKPFDDEQLYSCA